jgi:hypothetical protein
VPHVTIDLRRRGRGARPQASLTQRWMAAKEASRGYRRSGTTRPESDRVVSWNVVIRVEVEARSSVSGAH